MAGFEQLIYYFQAYGVLDFLLPFLLVFIIVFAVLQRTNILGENNRKLNAVLATILGLIFVVPHLLGTYPLGYDPVAVLNSSLPSISLVAVAAVMLLILMGIFGGEFQTAAQPIIGILSIIFVGYIFGSSLGLWVAPSASFSWWDDQLTELLVIIAVFGLVIWFIIRDPPQQANQEPGFFRNLDGTLGRYIGRGGNNNN